MKKITFIEFIKLKDIIKDKLDNHEFIMNVCNKITDTREIKMENKYEVHPLKKSIYNIINKISDKNINLSINNYKKLLNIFDINNSNEIIYFQYIIYITLNKALMDKKIYDIYIKLFLNCFDNKLKLIFIDICEIFFYNIEKTTITLLEICNFYNLLYQYKILNYEIINSMILKLFDEEKYLEVCSFFKNTEFNFYIDKIKEKFKEKKISNILRFKIMDVLNL